MATDFKMTTDSERLQAIRARRAAITPGEWGYDQFTELVRNERGNLVADISLVEMHDADGFFIANAPADIDHLLAALDAANAEIARLTAEDAALKMGVDILNNEVNALRRAHLARGITTT